jgi:DNA polymerase-3 subunit gamma/tau
LLVEFTLMQLCALNGQGAAEKKNDQQNVDTPLEAPISPPTKNNVKQQVQSQSSQPNGIETHNPAVAIESSASQTIAQPQPGQLRRSNGLKSSTTIASFTKPQPGQQSNSNAMESIAVVGNRPVNSFTQEQLDQAWKAFADQLKAAGKFTDHASLTMHPPEKVSDDAIRFTVFNAMALERLEADKTELMTFLRERLQNYQFTLELILSKEPGKQRPYTSHDKFKRLTELNPNLQKLRQQFDLDVEM